MIKKRLFSKISSAILLVKSLELAYANTNSLHMLATQPISISRPCIQRLSCAYSSQTIYTIRGGETIKTSTKKSKRKKSDSSISHKKKKKKSNGTNEGSNEPNSKEGKKKVNDTMKRKDSAKALGDAIRDRKDILQKDPILPPPMEINDIDASLLSLGLSLGTSDPRPSAMNSMKSSSIHANDPRDTYDRNVIDGGGVEASRTSILANYFLQSHGGAYVFQCTVSALSVSAGLIALFLPFLSSLNKSKMDTLILVLIRRCLLCALLKHASGLLSAAILSARRIPEIGLYKTRKRVEELASDPVAQYLFYCSLLMVWLPATAHQSLASSSSNSHSPNSDSPGHVLTSLPWFLNSKIQRPSIIAFLGPILLREIIHSAWVIYDVCIILGASSSTMLSKILKVTQSGMDASMSIILSPSVWRNADSRKKQRLLAKLVSRASLLLEIGTGGIIALDLMSLIPKYFFSTMLDSRPKLSDFLKKAICARLYFNYMLVRKRKIISLVGTIRGGALQVPGRIMDILLEPKKNMGIQENNNFRQEIHERKGDGVEKNYWMDSLSDALGI